MEEERDTAIDRAKRLKERIAARKASQAAS
jgi:hypothetical protein